MSVVCHVELLNFFIAARRYTDVLFTYLLTCVDDLAACRLDHSLRRQLETVATLKLNAAELHQSKASVSPVRASVVVRCPVLLVHFNKQLSTSGSLHRSKVKGDGGSRRSDVGDERSSCNKDTGSVVCPSCGHPCSRMQIFMCRLRALLLLKKLLSLINTGLYFSKKFGKWNGMRMLNS